MKKRMETWILIATVAGLSSCTSLLPVNNSYEKAGTLQKGTVEVSGHYTKYDVQHFERTETSNRNYGMRVGFGVTDRFDLKFRYEKLNFSPNFDGRVHSAHHVSFVPKIAAVPGKLSFLLPISNYYVTEKVEMNEYRKTISSIAPQMIFTLTNRKRTMDASLSTKMDFLWGTFDGGHNLFLGISVGAGFSTDLDKWAIRPEIGFATSDNSARYFSYGIGLQLLFRPKKWIEAFRS